MKIIYIYLVMKIITAGLFIIAGILIWIYPSLLQKIVAAILVITGIFIMLSRPTVSYANFRT